MKLYLMKQSALDYLKANMASLYNNYYQFDSPEWIEALFDYDPFEVFDVVPDFELTDLSLPPGEVDLNNCKILYTHLRNISDSQASDERLWAGLCNKTFYPYVRKRWQYARKHLKKTADDSLAIMSRFLYRYSGRAGMFRNTLARCWWTGRLTYTEKNSNHWELLDAIGPEDLISKISDIFFSNTFSSNPTIVKGFCEGLKFFRDRGIPISNRQHIRPTSQYLNAIGGGILLDTLSSEEVTKLVTEYIGALNKGSVVSFSEEVENDDEDRLEIEDEEIDKSVEEVNVDFADYIDSLEPVAEIDLDQVLGELTHVEYGCTVYLHNVTKSTYFLSKMPMVDGDLNMLQEKIFGQGIGFLCTMPNSEQYEIVDIRRS